MGAYNRGGIRLLCSIAQPRIGILTGINEQHMATFGSQDKIIKTKFELIKNLPSNGLAIFNGNNKFCLKLYKKTKTKISKKIIHTTFVTAVTNVSYDLKTEEINLEKEKISFKVISKNRNPVDFELNLAGDQNIENLLMAISCAQELGMNLEEIAWACKKIKPFEKTMELKKGIDGVTIIDDTYAANPQGVFAALDYLKLYNQKKIVIMPCLIELGKSAKMVHEQIGRKIGQVCDLAVITTRDYFKEIKKGALDTGMKKENILFLENPQKIFEKIKSYCVPNNIILLESRVPNKLVDIMLKN